METCHLTTPKLVVFDLDFTLWDCGGTWCDCLSPPFETRRNRVLDSAGSHIRLYEDVDSILEFCDRNETVMGLASRTEQPGWARQLIDLLGISDRFEYAEIYPSSKVRHFQALREQSGTDFSEMLFFDDEMRNIRECSALGVECVFVEQGLNREVFDEGWKRFSNG